MSTKFEYQEIDKINTDNLNQSKNYVIKNNYWNNDHEKILKSLLKNTNRYYREYQKAHIHYKTKLQKYRIPIIIMSSISGFLSISNSGYIPPEYNKWVSLLVGFSNLMVTVISLIENFKKIDTNVNKTYSSYVAFKKLHDEVSLILSIPTIERDQNGYDMVNSFFERYETYLNEAPVLNKIVQDHLDAESTDNISQSIRSTSEIISDNGYAILNCLTCFNFCKNEKKMLEQESETKEKNSDLFELESQMKGLTMKNNKTIELSISEKNNSKKRGIQFRDDLTSEYGILNTDIDNSINNSINNSLNNSLNNLSDDSLEEIRSRQHISNNLINNSINSTFPNISNQNFEIKPKIELYPKLEKISIIDNNSSL